jgi:hypothetical protein
LQWPGTGRHVDAFLEPVDDALVRVELDAHIRKLRL